MALSTRQRSNSLPFPNHSLSSAASLSWSGFLRKLQTDHDARARAEENVLIALEDSVEHYTFCSLKRLLVRRYKLNRCHMIEGNYVYNVDISPSDLNKIYELGARGPSKEAFLSLPSGVRPPGGGLFSFSYFGLLPYDDRPFRIALVGGIESDMIPKWAKKRSSGFDMTLLKTRHWDG